MPERRQRKIRAEDVQGVKYLRKLGPLLSGLRKVGTERDRAGNRKLFMDQSCALTLPALFSPAVRSLRDLQQISGLAKVRKRRGRRSQLSTGRSSSSSSGWRSWRGRRSPAGSTSRPTVCTRTSKCSRERPCGSTRPRQIPGGQRMCGQFCSTRSRPTAAPSSIGAPSSYGLWNAVNAVGCSYVCRLSDRTAATVMHVNDPTEAD